MITNKEIVGNLDVTSIYEELMATSTAEDSVYIRTKETLQAIVMDANLTEREKAEIISQTLATITNTVTNTAMQTAVQIAKENRDAPYTLTKIGADTDLVNANRDKTIKETALLDKQIEKVDADIAYERIQGWAVQAGMYRETGVKTEGLSTAVPVLTFTGHTEENGTKVHENRLLQAKTYDAWAGTARSNGLVSVGLDANYMPTSFNTDTEGLTYQQTRVAQRQYQAFDDNKRQHAVNSSASMLGVMIGSSAFTDSNAYTSFLDDWRAAMNYLNTGSVVSIDGVTGGSVSATFPLTLTRALVYTVTGTTVNILAGTTVRVDFLLATGKVQGGTTIVNTDGTWTLNVADTITADLPVGAVEAKAYLLDATGTLVTDYANITVV